MSSSDGTGAARKALAEEPQIAAASTGGDDEDGLMDPWFAPGPKVEATEADPTWDADTDGEARWFLPAGRAGLRPDSMESWEDSDTALADQGQRAEAAGAPPWGRDSASGSVAELPPWENGPWPGPGETLAPPPMRGTADLGATEPSGRELEAGRERGPRSRLVIVVGAAALVLVVMIVVIVVAASGGSAAGCATYPAPVLQAYTRAMSDLSDHAAVSVQASDLEHAASMANAAAAATTQIRARTALFAMASDLITAYSDVTRHRQITPDLQQRLAADGTALPRTC